MRREGLAGGTFALEGRDRRRLGGCAFGGDVLLGRGGRGLFEFELHLLDEAQGAFGPGPVDLALEHCLSGLPRKQQAISDLELLMGDRRRVVGVLGAGQGQLRRERRDITHKPGRVKRHARESTLLRENRSRHDPGYPHYPATCGRQVCCGARQSIPSSI